MPNGHPLSALERYLEEAPVLDVATFETQGPHAHPTYRLILGGAIGVLEKPADEIGDGDLLVKREVAAWVIARELGWPDLLAATVLRSLPSVRSRAIVGASLQVIWPDCLPDAPPDRFPDEDIWRAAVFDAVVGQTDRTGHNWPRERPVVSPETDRPWIYVLRYRRTSELDLLRVTARANASDVCHGRAESTPLRSSPLTGAESPTSRRRGRRRGSCSAAGTVGCASAAVSGVRYRIEEARMGPHVDVVKNEWLAGFQHVVARVRVDGGRVEIESPEPETWEPVVLRPTRATGRVEPVYAEKEPEEFLRLLPASIHGTYLFATDVHLDEACPFLHHPVLPITSVEDSHRLLPA